MHRAPHQRTSRVMAVVAALTILRDVERQRADGITPADGRGSRDRCLNRPHGDDRRRHRHGLEG